MSPTQPDAASRAIEPRQRLIGLAIIVGLALVVGLIVAALRPPAVTPGAPGTGPAGPAASTSATPTPSIPQAAREKVWTSDMAATGKYALNGVVLPPGKSAPSTKKYVVKVETSVPQQADDVARQVHGILSDERSWVGYGKTNFELVAAEGTGVLTVYLASPKTSDKLCQPAKTEGKWSCRSGNNIVLNADRWLYMTPTYSDLGDYRAYMVNHEFGHALGLGHAKCPRKGAKAPVMMQQSISLDGCVPNAWPRTSD